MDMFQTLIRQFEMSRQTAGTNLRAMEGMRGFAVLLVFLTHFCTLVAPSISTSPALTAFAAAVHAIGNTGVDLFFVLSGYLIYKTLIERKQGFLRFMGRRIRRIYPAFIAVFAVYWALSVVFPGESSIPADRPLLYLAENLLLLPGLFPIKPLITVAWSLSYEMFFYLCLPLVITSFGLRQWSPAARIALIGAVATALAATCTVLDVTYTRLIMFMAGMLVHEAMASRQARAPAAGVASCMLVLGLAGSLMPVSGHIKTALLFVSFYVVCMNCFVRPTDGLARAFSWTPLRLLGNMSYSYYLLHGLTLKALFLVLSKLHLPAGHALAVFCLLLPVFFVITLCTSAGLFLLIEKPLSLGGAAKRTPDAVPAPMQDAVHDLPLSNT
jgi:exopolysaccharide production protein ExoZ